LGLLELDQFTVVLWLLLGAHLELPTQVRQQLFWRERNLVELLDKTEGQPRRQQGQGVLQTVILAGPLVLQEQAEQEVEPQMLLQEEVLEVAFRLGLKRLMVATELQILL
jgi:hypothetical protein